jgi:hypothetical protein
MACEGGACVCENGTLCDGACVNTSNDVNNCGGCSQPCEAGATCSMGECETPVADAGSD